MSLRIWRDCGRAIPLPAEKSLQAAQCGRPQPPDDCEEIAGDRIGQRIAWKSKADVSSLAGKPIRLHVKMKRAKLYAFQFVAD